MAAFLVASSAHSVHAQVGGTWTGTGGLDGNWSTASNWAGGMTPTGSTVASATAVINFGATTGTTIVNQDLGFPFLLNRLTFTSDLPITGSSPSLFTLTGGALQFVGAAPEIIIRSITNSSLQTINNQLIIGGSNGLQITAQGSPGSNAFIINGDITSAHAGNVTLTIGGAGYHGAEYRCIELHAVGRLGLGGDDRHGFARAPRHRHHDELHL